MIIAPRRPYRILRHHTMPNPIAIYYSTRERRDACAQAWADRDGHSVLTELWSEEHSQDHLNQGWACDGTVAPAVVTLTLHIDNHYPDGTVPTQVTTTVPMPEDLDREDDWAIEHLLNLTGTGPHRSGDDAIYDVLVVASTVPALVGRTYEF